MRTISLFSGAGGFDLGLIKAGHEIVLANDILKDACETYKKNISQIFKENKTDYLQKQN